MYRASQTPHFIIRDLTRRCVGCAYMFHAVIDRIEKPTTTIDRTTELVVNVTAMLRVLPAYWQIAGVWHTQIPSVIVRRVRNAKSEVAQQRRRGITVCAALRFLFHEDYKPIGSTSFLDNVTTVRGRSKVSMICNPTFREVAGEGHRAKKMRQPVRGCETRHSRTPPESSLHIAGIWPC